MTPFIKFAELMRKDRRRALDDSDIRAANKKLFAAWDAERAKGYGNHGLTPDDIGMYDDINSKTYGGDGR